MLLCSLFPFSAETLDRWQRKAVLSNPGLDLEVPVEIGVIFLAHFADEMLLRAVVLQGKPPFSFTCALVQWQGVPIHCCLISLYRRHWCLHKGVYSHTARQLLSFGMQVETFIIKVEQATVTLCQMHIQILMLQP